jgi:hypothetical protein
MVACEIGVPSPANALASSRGTTVWRQIG